MMRSIRLPYSLCLAILLAFGGTGILSATLVSYDNLGDWEAATSPGYGLTDFEVSSGATSYSTSSGYQVNDLSFVGITTGSPTYFLYVIDAAVYSGHDYGSGDVLKGPASATTRTDPRIQVTLPSGTTSFGVDLMTYDVTTENAGPQTFNVRVDGATPISQGTLAQPNRQFFGITSTDPIGQVEFVLVGTGPNIFPMLDNFRYGASASISESPEPGTYLLVGGGLLLAGFYRRRRVVGS